MCKTIKMVIIRAEIMKTIDERERCDTWCIVIKWTNNEVQFTFTDNQNNTWKRTTHTHTQTHTHTHTNKLICKATFIFRSNLELALSIILKQK